MIARSLHVVAMDQLLGEISLVIFRRQGELEETNRTPFVGVCKGIYFEQVFVVIWIQAIWQEKAPSKSPLHHHDHHQERGDSHSHQNKCPVGLQLKEVEESTPHCEGVINESEEHQKMDFENEAVLRDNIKGIVKDLQNGVGK